jgi:hypothetical protein
MRPLVVATLLLSGCIVYERRPYTPDPEPVAGEPARRAIPEQQAVDVAFRLCQDRNLWVDRVEHAELDSEGRWHVTLVGYLDRAQMLLDGRDGKLLKGRFKKGDALAPGAPAAPPSPSPSAPSPGEPPPSLPPQPPPPEPGELD